MLLKPLDFGIVFPMVGIVIGSFVWVYAGTGGRGTINLKSENGEWVFPMDTAETITISGPLGETVVAIQEGSARVIASPCLNQSCVAAGLIHSPGQWTACLPNRVMVYVSESESNGASGIDAAAW